MAQSEQDKIQAANKIRIRMEDKAEKQVLESAILVDFLIAYNRNLDEVGNYSSKMLQIAREWKEGTLSQTEIKMKIAEIYDKRNAYRRKAEKV